MAELCEHFVHHGLDGIDDGIKRHILLEGFITEGNLCNTSSAGLGADGDADGAAQEVCIGEHEACADGTVVEEHFNALCLKLVIDAVGFFGNLLVIAPQRTDMYLPGRDGDGPDGAVIIPARFAYGGGKPADAYAVAAHDGGLHDAVLIGIAHAHGFGVLGAELEDIADLDTACGADALFAAFGANRALIGLGDININGVGGEITLGGHAGIVETDLIRTAYEVMRVGEGTVEDNGCFCIEAERPYKAVGDIGGAVLICDLGMDLALEEVAELYLVDLKITAEEYDDKPVIGILAVEDCLAGILFGDVQKSADLFYRLAVRSGYHGELGVFTRFVLDDAGSDLHIGTKIAFIADNEGILADLGGKHEFIGDLAAHHAGVALNGENLGHAAAREDTVVCFVAFFIEHLKIFLSGME